MRTFLALGLGAALVCLGSVAAAAPAQPCVQAEMFPTAKFVPANLPAFGYTALTAQSTDVHLFQTTSGAHTELPVSTGPTSNGLLKVAPSSALVSGNTYELDFSAFCNYGAVNAGPYTFTATDAAPIPTQLATLVGAPTATTKDFGTTQFSISASYTFTAEMKPWVGVYQIFAVLDGRTVATKATTAGGDNVLVSATGWCDATNAATQQHTLLLRATLPFSPDLNTETASLTFNCPAPNVPPPPPPGSSTSSSSSGGSSGVSSSSGSSGVSSSSGSTSGAPIGGSTAGDPGKGTFSCSASQSSSFSGTGAALGFGGLFAMIGAALVRRRRRSS